MPLCVISHLETISVKGFIGQRDEMKVAKYLLKNGLVLNNMTRNAKETYLKYASAITRILCLQKIDK